MMPAMPIVSTGRTGEPIAIDVVNLCVCLRSGAPTTGACETIPAAASGACALQTGAPSTGAPADTGNAAASTTVTEG